MVTSFVHIGGILLTFSYLIIPAVCASYLAESLRRRLLVGWIIATVAGMAGLQAAVQLDVPIGAALVCALGLALLLVMIVPFVKRRLQVNPTAPGAGSVSCVRNSRSSGEYSRVRLLLMNMGTDVQRDPSHRETKQTQ